MLAEVQGGSSTNLSWDGNETLEQLLECGGWKFLLASNTDLKHHPDWKSITILNT